MSGDVSSNSTDPTTAWRHDPAAQSRAALVRYRLGEDLHTLRIEEPDRTASAHGLQATWRWQPEGEGYRMWVRITHRGETPVQVETVDVVTAPVPDLGGPPGKWIVYQNGWQTWTPTFARHPADGFYTEPGTPAYRRMHQPHREPESDGLLSSEWVTVITNRASRPRPGEQRAVLVGFITAADQLAEVRIHPEEARVTARCHFDGVTLAPGESVRSEVLAVQAGPAPLRLLEWWATRMGEEMQARLPATPPTGWCTWYYFYGENTAADVVANVGAIARHGLPLDAILIDDGYQTAIGDWFSLDTQRFPEGVAPVARVIHGAGHRLGLWTAPFGAAADSRLFAEHPDWVLRDDAREPVVGWEHAGEGDCYALDCTHPEVLGWLRETFGRMRAEWGVELFKIDFIFAAALPGRRHDPTGTRAQALRRGVEAIRAGVGDDAFLLGCGAPLGPCVGLVDGMRVGPDVDPNWHPLWSHDLSAASTENALRNAVTRAPLHNRLWINDPDCLLARQRGDEMELVLNEVRTLAALTALLGGVTIDSDNLSAIQPGRLKYLRQTLPPTGVAARPLDLFQHEMPRRLVLPVKRDWGRWWVAGLVNWDDRTTETVVRLADLGLPPGRYHVYHYWRRRYLGVTDDAVVIRRHQPHETAVLLFKPVAERPDLLTTTFHVCQGMVEVADCRLATTNSSLRMRLILEKAGRQFGRALFTLPEGWRVVEARVDGRQQPPVTEALGVVSLGLTLEGRTVVEMGFGYGDRDRNET